MTKAQFSSLPVIILAILFCGSFYFWNFCRIEPDNGEIAILIKKTGKTLPPDQIIAPSPQYKGIQLEVLPEGRYFQNPYTWQWKIAKITDIPAGSFGVLVRKFGKDLPEGSILAPSKEYKGIVAEVLGTGKHRINPYAYDVQIYNDIRITPGNIGVVTNLTGNDIFNGTQNNLKNNKGFITDPDSKGIQATVLNEGTHRINPFLQSVAIVNIQSQRSEFSGKDTITFITLDGFTISLEGTVEFNILESAAPCLTHEVGDMKDIMQKLILPSVSGFARIEGSKKTAAEFISGASRQEFQNNLEDFLRKNSETWGISINSVLIRDIRPPQEIAEIIRNRELALQEAKKYIQQITQAKSATKLAEQEMLALQEKAKVDAETQKITKKINADQQKLVETIAAKTELEAATLQYQKAEADTQAKLNIAEAKREIIAAQNISEVEVMKRDITAYGGGQKYVTGLFYKKVAPQIQSIITKDNENGLFGLPLEKASLKGDR
ncbi:MAG: SPFH domain-containing protein [Lentisphaeria bacterium]